MLTMQDALARLTGYWTDQGCLVVQPMNTEVGAGTLNPATFLRVLGPEPWRVVYVEPSVRPDDTQYGEYPNRLQTHTQLQVVLNPTRATRRSSTWAAWSRWASTWPRTTCGSSRTTGPPPRSAPGAWAGRSGWTAWRSPSSPTSSRPAA